MGCATAKCEGRQPLKVNREKAPHDGGSDDVPTEPPPPDICAVIPSPKAGIKAPETDSSLIGKHDTFPALEEAPQDEETALLAKNQNCVGPKPPTPVIPSGGGVAAQTEISSTEQRALSPQQINPPLPPTDAPPVLNVFNMRKGSNSRPGSATKLTSSKPTSPKSIESVASDLEPTPQGSSTDVSENKMPVESDRGEQVVAPQSSIPDVSENKMEQAIGYIVSNDLTPQGSIPDVSDNRRTDDHNDLITPVAFKGPKQSDLLIDGSTLGLPGVKEVTVDQRLLTEFYLADLYLGFMGLQEENGGASKSMIEADIGAVTANNLYSKCIEAVAHSKEVHDKQAIVSDDTEETVEKAWHPMPKASSPCVEKVDTNVDATQQEWDGHAETSSASRDVTTEEEKLTPAPVGQLQQEMTKEPDPPSVEEDTDHESFSIQTIDNWLFLVYEDAASI